MKREDKLINGVSGRLMVKKTTADGVVSEFDVPNTVVTTGLNHISGRLDDDTTGSANNQMSHMGLGSDSTGAAIGNTGLGSQNGDRVTCTSTVSNNTVTYVATFGPGVATGNADDSTGTIREAGIFNAAASQAQAGAGVVGTMLCRTVFQGVNKEAGDSIQITWVVTIS